MPFSGETLTPSAGQSDGGRNPYFNGKSGDCVTRAVAIATNQDYRKTYDDLSARMKATGKPKSARNSIPRKVYEPYLFDLGWIWNPTMSIGSGCRVHLRDGEVPEEGPVITSLSGHITTVVDGIIRDTHDPSRDGTRCVYGWYEPGGINA